MTDTIHFHSSDNRFCGSTRPMRKFTSDPNKVTCALCRANDTFVLSPEAAEYVRSLNERPAA